MENVIQPKRIVAFHHVATLGNYNFIHHEFLNLLKNYGFLDIVEKIYLCVVGSGEVSIPYESDKVEFARLDSDVRAHEICTVDYMQKFARENPNTFCAKSHSCGVKSGNADGVYGDPKYPYWRRLQWYHLFVKYQRCLDLLEEYDCVGVELLSDPATHFSGTHYISRGKFIAELPDALSTKNMSFGGIGGYDGLNCHCSEFIVGLHPTAKLFSLYNTGYHWGARHASVEEVVKPFLNNLNPSEKYWEHA